MTPVAPSAFKAIVPGARTTLAEAIRLVDIEFPVLFYQWFAYAFNPDGTLSDAFATALCNIRAGCSPPAT